MVAAAGRPRAAAVGHGPGRIEPDRTRRRARGGEGRQRTLLDVLNAEQELLNSEVALVTTRRNLVVAAYPCSRPSASSTPPPSVASQVYDPEAHYFEVRRKWWGISITHRDGHREVLDLWPTHGQRASVK